MIRVSSFHPGNDDLIVLIGEEDSSVLPEVKESLLSEKDTKAPLLDESDCNFVYD